MLTCKCGNELKWEDTSDVEGGILEGYIIEQQLWECPKCKQTYEVQLRANVDLQQAEVKEILEVE